MEVRVLDESEKAGVKVKMIDIKEGMIFREEGSTEDNLALTDAFVDGGSTRDGDENGEDWVVIYLVLKGDLNLNSSHATHNILHIYRKDETVSVSDSVDTIYYDLFQRKKFV